MRLYYTVASQQDDPQAKPNLSLGGYKSLTPVPNSILGNLFGDISMYSVKNASGDQFIGLMLVNDGVEARQVQIWFKYPTNCASVFKLAAVSLATDTDGQQYMEHISNYSSKPLYAEFEEADGEVNRVNVGDIPAGGMIGLWVSRTLNLECLKVQQNAIYTPDPADPYRFNEIVLPKEDLIEIGMSWDIT